MENLQPKLRFPEFKEDWESDKIGNLLSIQSGKDYKHLKEGNIPVYGTGGLMLHVNDFLHDGKSVCIGRKGTIDKPMFLNGKFWTVDTLFYSNNFKNTIPEYVYLCFLKINWKNHNEAGGVPSLSKKIINNILLSYPTLQEQTKIADFLGAVDKQLDILNQKKEKLTTYKKGVMQQLFSQQIRFKDDNGNDFPDWQEKKIKDLFIYKNGKSFENDLDDNGKYFLISLNSIDISGELKKTHKRLNNSDNSLSKGDIVMVLSDVAHGNFLGLSAVLPNDNFVLNQRMAALKPFTEDNTFFIRYLINFNQKYFKLKGQGSSQLNLSKGDVENFKFFNPSIEEQTKIANFLSAIDNQIETVENQITKTETYKKGLLQQMFV
ncbi:restriction endonuclease subunit S [Empedobacter falsenii]